MRTAILVSTLVLVWVSSPRNAKAQDPSDAIFDTKTDERFGDAKPALIQYLQNELPLKSSLHHFCIIGYQSERSGRRAYVHWQEGRKLILWEGAATPQDSVDSIRASRRQLSLNSDVVKLRADLQGSTYRVTREWVDKVTGDCAKQGARYEVELPMNKARTKE